MKDDAVDGKSNAMQSSSTQLKQLCIENGLNISSSSPLSLSMKCNDNSKVKKEIEGLISHGDTSFEMREPNNIKSDVWRNGNFRIVYRDGQKLDFVMCLFCNSLITYKSKTGTASLLRHSCIKRLNGAIKRESSAIEEVTVLHATENEQSIDAESNPENIVDHLAFVNETEPDNEQYLVNEFSDDIKEEALKLFHYFNFKDMQPTNLTQRKGFFRLAQYLINIGAEYGKVNVESVFDTKSPAVVSVGDNFTNIVQKMLKQKLEDKIHHKVSLSCDYWADNNRKLNFFTLYGHYISDAYELKKLNLGTVSFHEELTAMDYKLLITSILEGYFPTEAEIDAFLSKTTIVTFDEMDAYMEANSTINCAASKLNQIMQHLIENYRDQIPNDIWAMENWSILWEYLDSDSDATDSKTVEELKLMLHPFTKALKSLCSDSKPTINEVYIYRKKLEDHFKKRRTEDGKICDLALKLIREHFPMADTHKVAIFLDPRFKSLKFMTSTEKANVLCLVNKMLGASGIHDRNNRAKSSRADAKANVLCENDDNTESTKYLIEYMDIDDERDETHDEIDSYMNLKFNDIYSTNILEFWESRYDLPQLRQLAREVLCIPATAIIGQKHFNDDASLLVKRRLNMEVDNIKQMLYIHENVDLLSNEVEE